ncbi:MAG: hypothetical protein LBH92_01750 [Bacteroidales bacterium]|jgi:hypothetical protein|nr:hypothetical protein [Bacteroidales bacterium]
MKYIKNHIYTALFLVSILATACYTPDPVIEKPPQIAVLGANPLKTPIYFPFVDDTLHVHDYYGLDTVWVEHDVDTSLLGRYNVFYYARTLAGMSSEANRDVWVVVQPKSMETMWDIEVVSRENENISYDDSLTRKGSNLIINNLNNIEGAEVLLQLASDLQDSVYIYEQVLPPDSLKSIIGTGFINEKATVMELNYTIFSEEDTATYHAVYKRKTIGK